MIASEHEFESFLLLLVKLPSFHDTSKFSGNGSLNKRHQLIMYATPVKGSEGDSFLSQPKLPYSVNS